MNRVLATKRSIVATAKEIGNLNFSNIHISKARFGFEANPIKLNRVKLRKNKFCFRKLTNNWKTAKIPDSSTSD